MNTPTKIYTSLILPTTPKKSDPFKVMSTPQSGPVNAPKKLEFNSAPILHASSGISPSINVDLTTPLECGCTLFEMCPPCLKASQDALWRNIRNAPPGGLEKALDILNNTPKCGCTPYEICMHCDGELETPPSDQESSQKTIITKTKTIEKCFEFAFSDPEKARVFEEMVKKGDHVGLKKEYPHMAEQMQKPKKTCPRLIYKGQSRQRRCGNPIYKWGICRRHWNLKYFMLKKK